MTASAKRNFIWAGLSQGSRTVLQLAGIAVLSRILPPADFGLLAMALVIVNLANLLRDMGTSAAVIQRHELTPQLLNSVFWLTAGFGILLAVLIVAGSPLAAWSFHEPKLIPLLSLLSINFPLSCSAATHAALMERNSQFRRLAAIEIGAAVVGLVTAIVMANLGYGVYSLAGQSLVSTSLSSLLTWLSSPWRPGFSFERSEIAGLWKFSSNIVGFNLVNYFARNADTMLIGHTLGSVQLGYYNMAYRVMLFPVQNLTWVVGRALLPVFSRLQHDRPAMGDRYIEVLSHIAFITAPLAIGVWLFRHHIIILFLGPGWDASSAVLAWLAPVSFIQSLASTTGTIFTATGRTDMMRKYGMLNTVLTVTAFAAGLPWGITGVAAAYMTAMVIIFISTLHGALRLTDRSLFQLLAKIAPPVGCAIALGGIALPIGALLRRHGVMAATELAIMIPALLLLYAGLARLIMPSQLDAILRAVFTRSIRRASDGTMEPRT
jgi:PST family polysaccharide transporter